MATHTGPEFIVVPEDTRRVVRELRAQLGLSRATVEKRAKVGTDDIGLLNQLWIGPIPTAFDRIKTERAQEGREALFHGGERFIDGKLFAQLRLPFQPQVFEGILLRGIGGKYQAGDFPFRFA